MRWSVPHIQEVLTAVPERQGRVPGKALAVDRAEHHTNQVEPRNHQEQEVIEQEDNQVLEAVGSKLVRHPEDPKDPCCRTQKAQAVVQKMVSLEARERSA